VSCRAVEWNGRTSCLTAPLPGCFRLGRQPLVADQKRRCNFHCCTPAQSRPHPTRRFSTLPFPGPNTSVHLHCPSTHTQSLPHSLHPLVVVVVTVVVDPTSRACWQHVLFQRDFSLVPLLYILFAHSPVKVRTSLTQASTTRSGFQPWSYESLAVYVVLNLLRAFSLLASFHQSPGTPLHMVTHAQFSTPRLDSH